MSEFRVDFLAKAHSEITYAGDVFYLNWDEVLGGVTAVVSTIGGFGSEEQMLRINGEANIVAVNAAKDFGIIFLILNLSMLISMSLLVVLE